MAVRELVAQPQEEMLAAPEICILTESPEARSGLVGAT